MSAVTPLDPRVYAVLTDAGFGPELFNPRQHESGELLERYTRARAARLLDDLGIAATLARPSTVEALLAAGGMVAGFRGQLRWLVDYLVTAGTLTRVGAGAETCYASAPATPGPPLDALRAEGLAVDPSYAAAYALLDEAAAIYPRVARGETSGERALFLRAALWAAYFDNRNAYYALNNRVTAQVAVARLPPAGRILEVGAGLGSATSALCDALVAAGRPLPAAPYRLTEPVPFFRRRAERTLAELHPTLRLTSGALDINAPWVAQEVVPGSFDLVWGVNVFHLARDIVVTLRDAHEALAPGGWLVIGEGIRPLAGEPVGAEFPFQLLESFHAVALEPGIRPQPGFLTAAQWLRALAAAGFATREIVPDVAAVQPFYAGVLTGAVCGRRR